MKSISAKLGIYALYDGNFINYIIRRKRMLVCACVCVCLCVCVCARWKKQKKSGQTKCILLRD